MDIHQRVTVRAEENDPALTTDALRGLGDQLVALDDDGHQWVRGTVELQPRRPWRWWAPWRRPRLLAGALVEISAGVSRPRTATTPSMVRSRMAWYEQPGDAGYEGQQVEVQGGHPHVDGRSLPPAASAAPDPVWAWELADGPPPGDQEEVLLPAPPEVRPGDAATGTMPAVDAEGEEPTQHLAALTGARRNGGKHRG